MNKKLLTSLITAAVASTLTFGTVWADETSSTSSTTSSSTKSSVSFKSSQSFRELVQSTQAVKNIVELCVFDQGVEYIDRCTTGKKSSDFDSIGWDLSGSPKTYESQYVESIEVKNGVITAKAKSTDAIKGESIIVIPEFDEDFNIKWVLYEESDFGQENQKVDSVISRIARYIGDNYSMFRKSNMRITIPAGEKFVEAEDDTSYPLFDDVNKISWASADLTYENKFSDPKLTSSTLKLSAPKIIAFSKNNNVLYTVENVNKSLSLECAATGLCSTKVEFSAKSASDNKLKFSDLLLSFTTENLALSAFMDNVCGIKNTTPDLVTIDELSTCLDNSDKFDSASLLLGKNFKMTASFDLKIDNKPIKLSASLSLIDNEPTNNLFELFKYLGFELHCVADKTAINKIPKEYGGDDLKELLDELDHDKGDSYNIEMICKNADCKVNGVSIDEIMPSDSSDSSED